MDFFYHFLGICGEHAYTHPTFLTVAVVLTTAYLGYKYYIHFTQEQQS